MGPVIRVRSKDHGGPAQAVRIAASRVQNATPRAVVEAALMAEVTGQTKPPEPPASEGGGRQPAPEPTSPSGTTADWVRAAPPTRTAKAAAPAEPPKVTDIPKITGSEKEHQALPTVKVESIAADKEDSSAGVEGESEHKDLTNKITVPRKPSN